MDEFLALLTKFFEQLSAVFMSILVALGLVTPGDKDPEIKQTQVASISAFDTIHTLEGGCTDGRYVYQVMIDSSISDETTPCKIVKIDSTNWQTVTVSEELKINHANDIAYDSSQKTLLISNNIPNYSTITMVDPATLTVTGTRTLPEKIYSLVYVGERDCYFAGISGTYDIVEFNKNYEVVNKIDGVDNGSVRQGLDSDGSYLYCIFYNPNAIYKYDFAGTYQGKCLLPDTTDEAENMFFLSGVLYVGYNILGATNGGFIAKVENVKYTTT